MNHTRLSLFCLAGYLLILGFGFLLAPHLTLRLLLSTGDYGDVFPRLAGMLLSGLGLTIVGIIAARAEALYPATLAVRLYFVVCLLAFYWMPRDPFFLVVCGIVMLGIGLTLTSYVWERAQQPLKMKADGSPSQRKASDDPLGFRHSIRCSVSGRPYGNGSHGHRLRRCHDGWGWTRIDRLGASHRRIRMPRTENISPPLRKGHGYEAERIPAKAEDRQGARNARVLQEKCRPNRVEHRLQ
jgi:hypothetical protein